MQLPCHGLGCAVCGESGSAVCARLLKKRAGDQLLGNGSRGGASRVDLVVIGGGMTGLALAAAVGSAGLDVLLVERAPLTTLTARPYDGRVTAVAQGGKRLLESIGVWPALVASAEPIRDIVVREGFSPLGVRYDHREIGGEPLGYIVENRHIREALLARCAELPSVTLAAPATIRQLDRGEAVATLTLESGETVRTPLVAVAEGRFSATREAAGIAVRRWAYWQTAIVCTFDHEHPHAGLAVERFFPDGPFARLPMTGQSVLDRLGARRRARQGGGGPRRSGIHRRGRRALRQ